MVHTYTLTNTTLTTPFLGQAIGEGTFGRVYKGLNERTGELLAIKQLSLADGTQSEVLLLRKVLNKAPVDLTISSSSDRFMFL